MKQIVPSDISRDRLIADGFCAPANGTNRASCVYRGQLWRHARRAHGMDRGQRVEVFSCGIYGECTENRVADGVACCATCPQFRSAVSSAPAADVPEKSVQSMVQMLRGPRRDWPDDWPYWGTTLEAHRLLAAEFLRDIPPYPAGRYDGRGIVILGGGPFFPGVYVTVHMIRRFGCSLPIEVWHHGTREPVLKHWLEPLGVRFVDIDAHVKAAPSPPRLYGAWASKIYAILHSSFEEVLYLDSDCYPVADVRPLFDVNSEGTIFWPDVPHQRSINWFMYPTARGATGAINGGQIVVDKSACWKALSLAQWWTEHADYSYRHNFGDQDVMLGSWQQIGQPFRIFAKTPIWRQQSYLIFVGPDGKSPLFVHRIGDKFRFPWLPISSPASDKQFYRIDPILGQTRYCADLPAEEIAFAYFHEFESRFDNDLARFRPEWLFLTAW